MVSVHNSCVRHRAWLSEGCTRAWPLSPPATTAAGEADAGVSERRCQRAPPPGRCGLQRPVAGFSLTSLFSAPSMVPVPYLFSYLFSTFAFKRTHAPLDLSVENSHYPIHDDERESDRLLLQAKVHLSYEDTL